ncbi:hypothetical protein HDU98_002917 [Podochytrium sp. JEL0797]|nr:hypothetical protein HDU98_002917 [Podochytrium sp. JEL0797]
MAAELQITGSGRSSGIGSSIIAFSGWGYASPLTGTIAVKLGKPLKAATLKLELIGRTHTRWTHGGKLITSNGADNPNKHAKTFFIRGLDVPDFQSAQVDAWSKFPFEFKLPSNGMYPSYESHGGCIRYVIKAILTWQEGLFSTPSHEVEVPVAVFVPNNGIQKLAMTPSVFKHEVPPTQEKCGCNLFVPSRTFHAGEQVTAELSVFSTPQNIKLRMIHVSIRTEIRYIGAQNRESTFRLPRPLSEFNETFSLLQINYGEAPLQRKLVLFIDPSIAQASLDSPLIQIKTRFQVQIICDNSETPNITLHVPLTVLPPFSDNDASSPMSPSLSPRASPRDQQAYQQVRYTSSMSSLRLDSSSNSTNEEQRHHHSPTTTNPNNYSPISPSLSPRRTGQRDLHDTIYSRMGHLQLDMNSVPFSTDSAYGSTTTSPALLTPSRSFRSIMGSIPGTNESPNLAPIDPTESLEETLTLLHLALDPAQWTASEVASLMHRVAGISLDVAEKFVTEGVDGDVLMSLTMEDLKSCLGMDAFLPRRRIMKVVEELEVMLK